VKYWMW